MTDFIIIILLIILIFQNKFKPKVEIKEKTNEEKIEDKKQLQRKEEFEKLMNYSIDDAIESKR